MKTKKIPFEYFCHSCGQLRLSLKNTLTTCGNCGSSDILEGSPGFLDKDGLKKQFKEGKKEVNEDG